MRKDKQVCAVCNSTDLLLLSPSRSENRLLSINRKIMFCNGCGLVFKYPAIADDVASGYWNDIYMHTKADSYWLSLENRYEDRLRTIANATVELLEDQSSSVQTVLDVGTQTGYFLKAFADSSAALGNPDASQLDLHGIDPGEDAIEFGRRNHRELTLRSGRLENVDLRPDYYDVITFVNVIYRFHDLGNALEITNRALKASGKLVVVIDFYFKDPQVEVRKRGRNASLTNWFETAQYMEYYFSKRNFEYLINKYCHIEACRDLGESYGYVYVLSPREEGVVSNNLSIDLDPQGSSIAERYLAEYADNSTAIKLQNFFQAHPEILNLIVVTSDQSGKDLVEYCKKHVRNIPILGLMSFRGNVRLLRKDIARLTANTTHRQEVAIFVSSMSHSIDIFRGLSKTGVPCFRTISSFYDWPYETKLGNTRVVWYTHAPERLTLADLHRPRGWRRIVPRAIRRIGRRLLSQ